MAFPKDYLNFEVWSRTKAIWIMSLINVALNAISVYLLWDLTNIMKAMVAHGMVHGAGLAAGAAASAASSHAQQIAVVAGGGK